VSTADTGKYGSVCSASHYRQQKASSGEHSWHGRSHRQGIHHKKNIRNTPGCRIATSRSITLPQRRPTARFWQQT